ncbi:MAG TPA: histidine kinase dimerization/phospho-acceptor domain-containing protein [Anaeromyxobacteraceae bacterium]|nr:histidine kinase dimerization/phospho-acceptor domain-containing protein [Anaeromyxobacteraceae bacterium]
MTEEHQALDRPPEALRDDRPPEAEVRAGFLGFVAHEMRNPLSTALWSAELLARLAPEERGGARGEKLAGMSLRALQRLRTLMEDHFLAERLDVSGIPLRLETVPLRDAIEAGAGKAAVERLAADVGDAEVLADRSVLERLLEALLAVSAKGSPDVRVTAERRDEAWAVLVQGAPPVADALAVPQKGSPSDPTGRALALHMAVRAARALGGDLQPLSDGFLLVLPGVPARQLDPAT